MGGVSYLLAIYAILNVLSRRAVINLCFDVDFTVAPGKRINQKGMVLG